MQATDVAVIELNMGHVGEPWIDVLEEITPR